MKHLEQTILKAIALSEKTRREGLLAAEDELYDLDESGLDILSYGMRLAVDGTDSQLIEKILTNMISRENDEKAKLLKIIQKEAVLCIQCGYNTRILALKLLSYLEENESRVIEGKILSDDIFIDDLDSDDAENIPPPSPVIPMDKDEFLSQAAATIKLVYSFSNKARREGLLSLEDELEDLDDEFLKMGLRLVVDGTDSTIINDIMSNKTDIEKDSSRKKLKTIQKIAVLSIQAGDNSSLMVHKIISLVDNPGLTVISKTLDGLDFFKKNDFKNDNPLEKEGRKFNELAADIIQKACMFSEKVIKNEISSLSSIIDKSKKDERGIFEYGMALVIQAMNAEDICFILSNLIDMEQNEEIKKLKLMQKEAVLSICHDENTALLLHTMLSFLNDKELEEVSKSLSDFAFVLKFNKLLALSTESSFHNDEDTLKMKLQYTDAADASTGSCEVINFFNKPRELVSETEKDLLNDFVKDEHPRTAAFILAWLSSGYFSAGGIDSVTDILLHTDRSIRKQIFKQWEKDDPELAEEVKDRMFSFSDIASMNDRDIQKVMREVDSQELAKALKKTDESVKEKIYYNMSKRAAAMIREDMEYMGPVRICNIEEAQRKIVSIIRHLDDAGEINKG